MVHESTGDPTVDLSIIGDVGGVPDGLQDTARQALCQLGLGGAELSLVLCDDAFIQDLNRDYRGKDRPTDVLSFSQREGEGANLEDPVLGDVIISIQTASRQAAELGHSLETELVVLMVHGILHLLGHDHEEAEEARRMADAETGLLGTLERDSRCGLIGRTVP